MMPKDAEAIKNNNFSFKSAFSKIPTIFFGVIAVLILLGIVSPNSVKPEHLLDFTRQAAPLIIVGIGQTIVMLVGGLDLSVGAVITMINIVANQVIDGKPENVGIGIFVCLVLGAIVGLFNGVMCAKLKMPTFVVTLGSAIFIKGVTLVYCGGAPLGSIPDNMRFWGNGFIAGIPAAAYVWAALFVVIFIVIKFTTIGRYVFSTGVNEKAVILAGYNATKIKVLAYVSAAVLAAISGLMVSAYMGTGSLVIGDDYQMNSIAVAVLGGAAFDGGRGSLTGTMLAALFLMIMFSAIAAMNMKSGDQLIIKGIIVILGLVLNNIKSK
jgi:ribose/xylose/arabinose/galactoside ABC-type transport system permease subunit